MLYKMFEIPFSGQLICGLIFFVAVLEPVMTNPEDARPASPGSQDVETSGVLSRLQTIKEKILATLNLPSRPKVPRRSLLTSANLPQPIRDGLFRPMEDIDPDLVDDEDFNSESDDGGPQKLKTVIVFAQAYTGSLCDTRYEAGCLQFAVDGIKQDEVVSAQLWLYQKGNYQQPYSAQRYSSHRRNIIAHRLPLGSRRRLTPAPWMQIAFKHVYQPDSWISVDVGDVVKSWMMFNASLDSKIARSVIKVECHPACSVSLPTDQHVEQHPFLKIKIRDRGREGEDSGQLLRHKRHVRRPDGQRCAPETTVTTQCCQKESMTINFTAIGWDWIIFPTEYQAYYCYNSCGGGSVELETPAFRRQNALNRARNISSVSRSCCFPTSLSPFSMLYYNEQGSLVIGTLSDQIVNSCGCC